MKNIFRRASILFGIPAAYTASALSITPAQAQTIENPYWFPAANSDCLPRGPKLAAGVVIYSHGRSMTSEDSQTPTPPYMKTLCKNGWDTLRFNRLKDSDSIDISPPVLIKEVRRLKRQGYRQVVLAGQSLGAFVSLITAGADIDKHSDVDAVVAIAPAAFGDSKTYPESWQQNATRLYPLLGGVKQARIMEFFFHDDIFDPGGRGEKSIEILEKRKASFAIIDRPAGFETHWAANNVDFAEFYGACITKFISDRQVDAHEICPPNGLLALDPHRPLSPAAKQSIEAASGKSATSGDTSAIMTPH